MSLSVVKIPTIKPSQEGRSRLLQQLADEIPVDDLIHAAYDDGAGGEEPHRMQPDEELQRRADVEKGVEDVYEHHHSCRTNTFFILYQLEVLPDLLEEGAGEL